MSAIFNIYSALNIYWRKFLYVLVTFCDGYDSLFSDFVRAGKAIF